MEKQGVNYTIDLVYLLKSLYRRLWIIILTAIIASVLCFSYAKFCITPLYSSYVKLYVNNNSFTLGSTSVSISPSDITAAQSLLKTYSDILDSRSTLERIKEKSGVNYSWKELSDMIVSTSSNNTEIMKVTVTTYDPYESSKIANTIATVLPIRISEIIDGASMEVVDSAVPNPSKVAPSLTRYTAIGFLVGVLLSVILLSIYILLDDKIYDEEYILQKYDYPILGKVPNLLNTNNKSYSYYSQRTKTQNK